MSSRLALCTSPTASTASSVISCGAAGARGGAAGWVKAGRWAWHETRTGACWPARVWERSSYATGAVASMSSLRRRTCTFSFILSSTLCRYCSTVMLPVTSSSSMPAREVAGGRGGRMCEGRPLAAVQRPGQRPPLPPRARTAVRGAGAGAVVRRGAAAATAGGGGRRRGAVAAAAGRLSLARRRLERSRGRHGAVDTSGTTMKVKLVSRREIYESFTRQLKRREVGRAAGCSRGRRRRGTRRSPVAVHRRVLAGQVARAAHHKHHTATSTYLFTTSFNQAPIFD